MIKEISKNQQGVVLLLTLLIMLVVTTAGLVISVVVLNKIKTVRNSLESAESSYAAESGVEKGLYAVTDSRSNNSSLLDMFTIVNNYTEGAEPFANGASFTVALNEADEDEYFRYREILPDESVEYHYYQPDNPTVAMGIEYVLPFWRDNCDGLSSIEISFHSVKDVLDGTVDESANVKKMIYDCGGIVDPGICAVSYGGETASAMCSIPDASESYVIRVKSLKKDPAILDDCLVTVRIEAFPEQLVQGEYHPDLQNQIHIPHTLSVIGVGQSRNSEISLEALVPWAYSVTGLTDFVIFSQEGITK